MAWREVVPGAPPADYAQQTQAMSAISRPMNASIQASPHGSVFFLSSFMSPLYSIRVPSPCH